MAVPDSSMRLGTEHVSNTTYSDTLPGNAFIDAGRGIYCSSPELLFIEMAALVNPVEHLVIGHELCGTFSRDPADPYNGPITYGVKPATSTARIRSFLNKATYIHGMDKAAATLNYLDDNAWSPTESIIAALLRLPNDSLGYDIGRLTLNPRVQPSTALPGSRESRVPDIMITDTSIGINYDGLLHLNLNSIVKAAIDLGEHPEIAQTQRALEDTVRNVRSKAVDDIRRNRELAVSGLFVFPVVKEDLYTPGGLDKVVEHLLDALEKLDGIDVRKQRKALLNKELAKERHRAILSLLPGKNDRNIQIGRFIGGHRMSDSPSSMDEYWIEL